MADLSVDSALSGESTTHSGRSRSSRSHHYSLLAYSLQAAVRANDLTPGEEQQIMECWIEVENTADASTDTETKFKKLINMKFGPRSASILEKIKLRRLETMNTLKKKKEELNKKMTEQETSVSSQPPVAAVAQANKLLSIAPSAPSSSSLSIPAPTNSHYGKHPSQQLPTSSTSQQLQGQPPILQQYLPHQSVTAQPLPLLQQFNSMNYQHNPNPSIPSVQGYNNQPMVQQQPQPVKPLPPQSMSHAHAPHLGPQQQQQQQQQHLSSQSYPPQGGQLPTHNSTHMSPPPPFIAPQFNNNNNSSSSNAPQHSGRTPAVHNSSTFQPMNTSSMNPHATAYTTANVDNKKGVAPPMKKTTTAAMKGDKPAEKKQKKMTKKELATQAAALSATSSGSSNHSNNFVSSSAHHPNSAAMSKGGMPPPAMLHQQQQKPLSVEQEIENMTERTSLAQEGMETTGNRSIATPLITDDFVTIERDAAKHHLRDNLPYPPPNYNPQHMGVPASHSQNPSASVAVMMTEQQQQQQQPWINLHDEGQPWQYYNIVDKALIALPTKEALEEFGMKISPHALQALSNGLQVHLKNIIEAAVKLKRVKENSTSLGCYDHLSRMIIDYGRGNAVYENKFNIAMKWGPNVHNILKAEDEAAKKLLLTYNNDLESRLSEKMVAFDEENNRPSNKRRLGQSDPEVIPWWAVEETAEKCGYLNVTEVAANSFKSAVAKKNECGDYLNKKKFKLKQMLPNQTTTQGGDSNRPTDKTATVEGRSSSCDTTLSSDTAAVIKTIVTAQYDDIKRREYTWDNQPFPLRKIPQQPFVIALTEDDMVNNFARFTYAKTAQGGRNKGSTSAGLSVQKYRMGIID